MLLGFYAIASMAQLPSVTFESITTKDGLPSNTVFSAAKDQKGFMWFGTRICPTRYDDTGFRNFLNHETNLITGLAADSVNNIWIATDRSGICRIRAHSLDMISIPTTHKNPSHKQTDYFFIDSHGKGWYSDWYGVNRMDLYINRKHACAGFGCRKLLFFYTASLKAVRQLSRQNSDLTSAAFSTDLALLLLCHGYDMKHTFSAFIV